MRGALLLLCLGLAGTATARTGPKIPIPKLHEVMAGSLTDRARIKWIRVIDGKQVEVTIGQGEAWRLNPNMSSERVRLKYDLNRNRELERQVKATKLGASSRSVSSVATDRTLQILVEGDSGDVVVGQWSMPLKAWKKKNPTLVELLDPQFDVQPELFQPVKGPER
jgi:hypothetical protein